MPGEKLPSQPDLGELSDQLQDGIETCRSVIANYRSLLTDEQLAANSSESDDDSEALQESGEQSK